MDIMRRSRLAVKQAVTLSAAPAHLHSLADKDKVILNIIGHVGCMG